MTTTIQSTADNILKFTLFPYLDQLDLINLSIASKRLQQKDYVWEICYRNFFNMSPSNLPDPNRFNNAHWKNFYNQIEQALYHSVRSDSNSPEMVGFRKSVIGFMHPNEDLSLVMPRMLCSYKKAIANENRPQAEPPSWPYPIDPRRELPYASQPNHEQVVLKLHQYVSRRFPTPKPKNCSWRSHYSYSNPNYVSRVRRIGETVGILAYTTTSQISLVLFPQLIKSRWELEPCNGYGLEHLAFSLINLIYYRYHSDIDSDYNRVPFAFLTTSLKILQIFRFPEGNITHDGLLASVGIQIGFLTNALLELTKEQSNTQAVKISYSVICALPPFLFSSGWSSVGISALMGYAYLSKFYGRNIIDCRTISHFSSLASLIGSMDIQTIPYFLSGAPTNLLWNRILNFDNPVLDTCIKVGGSLVEKCTTYKCAFITARVSQVCLSILKSPIKLVKSYFNWRATTSG